MATMIGLLSAVHVDAEAVGKTVRWKMGRPIVTYWAGPMPMTDAAAQQMLEGGWNVIWCGEAGLDIVQSHGLRGMLYDGLLSPQSLEKEDTRQKLDALIERVRKHPAFYCYFITDEPNVTAFLGLGKLVAYLRERDPEHFAYINLYPTYANNEQLGTKGDTVTSYKEHLRQYVEIVNPDLISYDHYHFAVGGDGTQYFLNLAMIRQSALDSGVPFLNIVQACSWAPSMRIPNGDEVRWLVYTSLAYGAQGISYYVYAHPGHNGAMATLDGKPTELYDAAKVFNREFEAIAAQVQPLRSLGAYHSGTIPQGALPLPENAAFRIDPPSVAADDGPSKPAQGFVLGYFGKPSKQGVSSKPTHVMVVNLNYKEAKTTTLVGPKKMELFDPSSGKWSSAGGPRVELNLSPGAGKLLRLKR